MRGVEREREGVRERERDNYYLSRDDALRFFLLFVPPENESVKGCSWTCSGTDALPPAGPGDEHDAVAVPPDPRECA